MLIVHVHNGQCCVVLPSTDCRGQHCVVVVASCLCCSSGPIVLSHVSRIFFSLFSFSDFIRHLVVVKLTLLVALILSDAVVLIACTP